MSISDKNKTDRPFVTFKPTHDGQIQVSWNVITHYIREESGRVTCYIRGFDIFFGVKEENENEIRRKSKAMVAMLFDHLFLHSGKNGLKNAALHMHKLGFKAKDDAYTLKRLIQNERISAKFNSFNEAIPASLHGSQRISEAHNMQVMG
jgi:hypothetical protein